MLMEQELYDAQTNVFQYYEEFYINRGSLFEKIKIEIGDYFDTINKDDKYTFRLFETDNNEILLGEKRFDLPRMCVMNLNLDTNQDQKEITCNLNKNVVLKLILVVEDK